MSAMRRHSTQNSLNSQNKRISAISALSALIVVFFLAAESVGLAQGPALTLTSAVPDPSGQTLTITGSNFGSRPLVTLDLLPVAVQFAVDTQIVAAVPVKMMPAGKYLLTVSRGTLPTDSASIQVALGGNGGGSGPSAQSPSAREPSDLPETTKTPNATDLAAQVGDRATTVQDIDREWRRTDPSGYLAFMRQLYDNRRRVADQMLADELIALEARARGLTPDALLAQEIPKRVVTTPESAVLALYQGLGDRARGATLEQLKPAIRAWLTTITEPEIAKMSYLEELMKVSTRSTMFLEAPRVKVERSAQDPVLGPADSPIEIVAFGDFDSAEYAQLAQAFPRVRDTFGDRVHFVFKNLPMIGPESLAIAQAAACAHAQGKFWAYHDAIIKRTGPIDSAQLKQLGRDVGVSNRAAFETCIDRDEYEPAMRQALIEADRYAIQSSPSFLVNGRLAPAPPPFLPPAEYFKRLVEEELLRQSKAAQPK
jgi:protein-disulfide isomerase